MVKFLTAILSVALGGLASASVDAQDASDVLQPEGQWVLDYGEQRCRAIRVFGQGEDRTLLLFVQYSPSDSIRWLIAGPYFKGSRRNDKVSIHFGPNNDAFEQSYVGTQFGDFGLALDGSGTTERATAAVRVDEQPEPPAGEQSLSKPEANRLDIAEGEAIEWIWVNRPRKAAMRLEVGNLGNIYKAMNACMDDLIVSWGLDLEQDRRRAKAPQPLNLLDVARTLQRNYPSGPLRRGGQTDLHIRLMVDPSGRVTDCVISEIMTAEGFGIEACEIMKSRLEFAPSVDIEGNPMRSYYTTQISYRIE